MCKFNDHWEKLFDCLTDCIQTREVSNPDFKLDGEDLNNLYSVIQRMKEGGSHEAEIRKLLENPATKIYGQFILWIRENRFSTTDELTKEFESIENIIVELVNSKI